MLMDAVDAGLGGTLQPWAAVGRFADARQRFHLAEIADPQARRVNALCSLSDDELSPAGAGHPRGAGRLRARAGALGPLGRSGAGGWLGPTARAPAITKTDGPMRSRT